MRIEYEGAIYHVTSRGNDKRAIFVDEKDRRRFVEKLGKNVDEHAIRLYAYVMMNNHYHLLLETPRANISSFMHQFNSSYVAYYNRRHQRCGHLYEGRYKAKLVEGDRYLLSLVRYIHLNPIKVSQYAECSLPEKQSILHNYAWSSYRAYLGLTRRETHVDYDPLLSMVANGSDYPELRFQQYVESGMLGSDDDLMSALVRSSKAIGGQQFCLWVEEECSKRKEQGDQVTVVGMRRVEEEVDPENVVASICGYYGIDEEFLKTKRNPHPSRAMAMKLLKECSGLSHHCIAAMLGVTDSSGISRRITRLNALITEDEKIHMDYNKLKKQLLSH